MKKTATRRVLVGSFATVSLVAGAVAGLGVTSAIGTGSSIGSSGAEVPEYDENARGQSYGSALEAISPETEPDLIQALADDKTTEGFVKKSDLDYLPDFDSPSEALAWQAEQAGKSRVIPVYDVDGTTKIGTFTITPATPAK